MYDWKICNGKQESGGSVGDIPIIEVSVGLAFKTYPETSLRDRQAGSCRSEPGTSISEDSRQEHETWMRNHIK